MRIRERDARRGGPWVALVGIAVLAAACAPAAPPQAPAALEALPAAPAVEGVAWERFTSFDGTELGLVAYRAQARRREAVFVYLHGIESHAGWFDAPARLLRERGYDVFCLDRRGSGINRENRDLPSGHVDSYEILLEDVHAFVEPLRRRYPAVFVIGLSWGGKLALAYGLTHPEALDGLVLITPGIRNRVDLGPATKLRVALASVFAPRASFEIPIRPEMFTTTPRFLAYIEQDPLRLRQVTARFLMEHRSLEGYIDRRIAASRLPILLFLAGHDRIIDNDAVLRVLERAPGQELTVKLYEDQTHSIQFDAPGRLVDDVAAWIESREAPRAVARKGGPG